MPKYYKKKYYHSSRDKYSVEHTAFELAPAAAGQVSQVVVAPSTTQGMRKVKHLTISMGSNAGSGGNRIFWALVYVPQGTSVGTINTAGSLYEPNQFVMGCGVFDFDAGPLRVKCPLSRNLNSGDSIYFVMDTGAAGTYTGVVSYAVTLQ